MPASRIARQSGEGENRDFTGVDQRKVKKESVYDCTDTLPSSCGEDGEL